MLDTLKEEVCQANRRLETSGLVQLTWGNASGCDHGQGLMVIKPSGVAYRDLEPEHMIVLELATGKLVEGQLRPSSDTKTHLVLYQQFPQIGGIVHTHSSVATSFSQAGVPLPCLGTTHADHFNGTVPVVRSLTAEEVRDDYELNTGRAIVEYFRGHKLDPMDMPAVFQLHHAPFTWGATVEKAVENSIALEFCAQMALNAWRLRPGTDEIPAYIREKHYQRKHGVAATYGQNSMKLARVFSA